MLQDSFVAGSQLQPWARENCTIICDRLREKGPLSVANDFSVQAFLVYVPETKNSDVKFFLQKLVSPTLCLHSRQI